MRRQRVEMAVITVGSQHKHKEVDAGENGRAHERIVEKPVEQSVGRNCFTSTSK